MRLIEVSAVPPELFEVRYYYPYEPDKVITGVSYKGIPIACPSNATPGKKNDELEYEVIESKPVARELVGTVLKVTDLAGVTRNIQLKTRWFDADAINYEYRATSEGPILKEGSLIGDMTACDQLNNVINCWEVPDRYITYQQVNNYKPDVDDGELLGGVVNPGNISAVSSVQYSNASVYNNKARYKQSVSVIVYNPASGNQLCKNLYDLLPLNQDPSAQTYTLEYVMSADIRPQGCPIFAWKYNNYGNNQLANMQEYIRGGPWSSFQVVSNGVNGSYFEKLQLANNKSNLLLSSGLNFLSGAVETGIGFASGETLLAGQGAAQMIGAIGHYAVGSVRLQQQEQMLNIRGMSAARLLSIDSSDFAKDCDNNKFHILISRYSYKDMFDYDAFLEKFGYNVGNMHIGTQHLWSRKNFIYIKANDLSIASTKHSQSLIDKVVEQLKAGVRIWREWPSIDAMNPGGNRTPENIEVIKRRLKNVKEQR